MARGRPEKGQTFWDRLDNQSVYDDNNCKLFMGARDKGGYGWVMKEGKQVLIHREVFKKYNPEINIDGFVVMHLCDQRNCINPQHLKKGTQGENFADMVNKGRRITAKGIRNYGAKIKDADVIAIRQLLLEKVKKSEIAKKFGLSESTIYRIASGNLWKHV